MSFFRKSASCALCWTVLLAGCKTSSTTPTAVVGTSSGPSEETIEIRDTQGNRLDPRDIKYFVVENPTPELKAALNLTVSSALDSENSPICGANTVACYVGGAAIAVTTAAALVLFVRHSPRGRVSAVGLDGSKRPISPTVTKPESPAETPSTHPGRAEPDTTHPGRAETGATSSKPPAKNPIIKAEKQQIELAMRQDDSWTALHKAAKDGSLEAVRAALATEGIDINARTKYGLTPLHIAAYYNKPEVVEGLLADNRMNIDVSSGPVWIGEQGYTAYALAAMHESAQGPGSAAKKIRANPKCIIGPSPVSPVHTY